MRRAGILLVGLLWALPAWGGELPEVTVQLGEAQLTAEVAATPEARTTGLSGRSQLGRDRGMLFVWEGSSRRHFWMKDTYIPLSVAFLDERGRIRNIQRMDPPSSHGWKAGFRRYPSRGAARFALEVRRGWFAEHGIGAGDRCHFRLPPNLTGTELVVGHPGQR